MKKIFLLILSMIVIFLGVNSVSAGNDHECGFINNGELKCWGNNNYGQLNIPIGFTWKSTTIGLYHTCGITIDNELKCWGNNTNGQLNIPTGFTWKSVSAGYYHTCGITIDNDLKCWGKNDYLQLNIIEGYKWKNIDSGIFHSCGITNDDELKCWGRNIEGQLNTPTGYIWKNISARGYHTCGITNTSELKCWGANWYGQLNIPNGYTWKNINTGFLHTCGITNDDELKCWGRNLEGQLNTQTGYKWKDITSGRFHSCGITDDDELKCWGYNDYGQLNFPISYKWYSFKENIEIQIPTPTNLKQYIKSPYSELEELLSKSNIGKFQSGSGILLSVDIENNLLDNFCIGIDIQKIGEENSYYLTGTINQLGFSLITVPYYGVGKYKWKARVESMNGVSDWVDFGTSEYDFSIFEGFEPYPHGYNFINSGPTDGVLTNTRKWEIFYKIFPIESFSSSREIIKAYRDYGLDEEKPSVFGGNCFGMSLSALMYKTNTGSIYNFEPNFYNSITSGKIWEDINISVDNYGKWNEYNDVTKTIYEYQLFQKQKVFRDTYHTSVNDGVLKVYSDLISNPNKSYILNFSIYNKETLAYEGSHTVIPYRVDGNKIYVWDNNIPYSNYNKSYEQYIEINNDGTFVYNKYLNKSLHGLGIVDIEVFNGNTSPIGFNDTDSLFTLKGKSDLIVTDSEGRISGFSGGLILEEIPGVDVIKPLNYVLGSELEENTWKQIYIPQKKDLTIKIIGKGQEKYSLMIAGGDYHTDIENVNTSTGEIDIFKSKIDKLEIDFDDTKTGTYNLLFDNFQENNIGTINIIEPVISNPQKFSIDWIKVINDSNDSILQEIDNNNDGIYNGIGDKFIILSSIFSDNISPITSYNISGELNNNTINSYIETVTINLEANDNEGGTGVDKIYYAIGTSTGNLLYVEYDEPIIVSGLGDYTLNYYSVDKFGNKEETKTLNFILTKKPETYAGKISGYIYDDINQNGILDSGEKTMAGWKVCIDLNNNNNCEENIEPFNVTNNNGYYEFNGLSTGTYKVIEIPHQNWIIVNPIDGSYTINLQNGQKVENKNFGNFKVKGGKNKYFFIKN